MAAATSQFIFRVQAADSATVTFTRNLIDSDEMGGGYLQYQLIPSHLVYNAGEISSKITTVSATLYAILADQNHDVYQATHNVVFDPNETITITGKQWSSLMDESSV